MADSLRQFFSRPAIKYPLALFVVARLLLSALGFVLWALKLVPPPIGPSPYYEIQQVNGFPAEPLLDVWQRYDAVHYIRIALEGYSEINLTAFYPLYPLLIRLVTPLAGGNALLAALAISNVACCLALSAFFRLLQLDLLDDQTSLRAMAYCLFFPTGFFLLLPYTEPIFLFLALVCALAAKKGRWGWAALAAVAASLTRFQGVALAPFLGVEVLRQAQWSPRRAAWRMLIPLAPLVGTGSFLLWRSWAGWPPMNDVLALIWSRVPGPPWQGLLLATQQIVTGSATRTACVEYPVTWLMLILGIVIVRRQSLSNAIYYGTLLLLNLSQYVAVDPLIGQARYAIVLFPAFMALAQLRFSPWLHRAIVAVFAAAWVWYACVIVLWGFVG